VSASTAAEIAAIAARLVVEDGMEYAAAKQKAARSLDCARCVQVTCPQRGGRGEVRAYLEVFCADTQPAELQALRELAATWMERLAEFRPTRRRRVARNRHPKIDDHDRLVLRRPKSAEIGLINQGIEYDLGGDTSSDGEGLSVLTLGARCQALARW